MDISSGKVKNAALAGCVLNTSEILNDKNYHPGMGRCQYSLVSLRKRAVTIYLSKNVNIKFIAVG